MSNLSFDEILEKRRSVRVYDKTAAFDEHVIRRGLERATLAPNSSNMQTWEFYWVKSQATHDALTHACMNQSAARTAQQLVVFVTRQDKWKVRAAWHLDNLKQQLEGKTLTKRDKRALDYYGKLMPLAYRNDFLGLNTLLRTLIMFYIGLRKPIMRVTTHADQRVICHKSCALAAQTFMLSLASEGYDTCPMEGFDERLVKKILKLPAAAEITMIVACGIGASDGIYNERQRIPNEEVIFEV
jgi:nitroreductase